MFLADLGFMRIDLIVIALFLLGTFAIGMILSGSSNTVEAYSVGDRNMRGWIVGLSVLGAFLSSITFLGVPAEAYKANWKGLTFGLALPIAALFATLYFIPLYRSGNRLSAYEFLEERFGYWARFYAAVSFALLQFVRTAMITLLVAFALEPMCDWFAATQEAKINAIILIMGVVVVVYDMAGGVRAAIWTDILQVSMFALSAAWCMWILWRAVGQDYSQLAYSDARFSLGSLPPPADSLGGKFWAQFRTDTFWAMLLYGVTETLRNYGTDQNYVQRILCTKTYGGASFSMWFGAIAYLPLVYIFCSIGSMLFLFYNGGPHTLPEGMKPDQVFPHFIYTELPLFVRGVTIAGILAAAMSTTDASMNSTSVVMLVDLIRPWRKRQEMASDIWILRSSTLVFGVLSTLVALLLFWEYGQSKSATLIRMWWQYAGVAGGGLFGLFLLAWLFPKTPSFAAAAGVVMSVPVLIWGVLAAEATGPVQIKLGESAALILPAFPLAKVLVGFTGTCTIVAVGLLGLAFSHMGLVPGNSRAVSTTKRR